MTDTMMHFLACFGITIVVFLITFAIKNSNDEDAIAFPGSWFIWLDIIIEQSIRVAMIVATIAGIGKEFVDIFRSDPQIIDLAFDGLGIMAGVIICRVIGNVYIEYRERKARKHYKKVTGRDWNE